VLTKDELQLTLQVQAEPHIDNFSLVGAPLVEKALDNHGQLLNMIMTAGVTPHNPNYPYGNVYYPQQHNQNKQTHQLQVRLKLGDKAPKSLKEFSGVLSAQVLLPTEPIITVADVMKANGKAVAGKNGGAIAVQSVKKIDGKRYQMEISLENPPGVNNLGNVMIGGGGQVVIQGNVIINGNVINGGNGAGTLVLVDAKGKAFNVYTNYNKNMMIANGKITQQKVLIFEANSDQEEPDRLMLVGRSLDVVNFPFRFENVTLP